MRTDLFGKLAALPVAIAPTGLAGLCWYEGEQALAKAAAWAASHCPCPWARLLRWSESRLKRAAECGQVDIWPDRVLMTEVIERARRTAA
jgi:(S)-mandelate dehydrogenase